MDDQVRVFGTSPAKLAPPQATRPVPRPLCAQVRNERRGRCPAEDPLARLTDILVQTGQCDGRALERSRRVAEDTGQRLDKVLLQLGLVTERGLADAYAKLLDLPVARPIAIRPNSRCSPTSLPARFLRNARAVPMAIDGDTLVVAVTDPLDSFIPAAIAAAVGMSVRLEVAVPIELDAALKRLYPDEETRAAAG